MKMLSYIEVAKDIITEHLAYVQTNEAVADNYLICQGDKEVLKKHIRALLNIFDKALKEIEENAMYKGMELNEEYTLKELGL